MGRGGDEMKGEMRFSIFFSIRARYEKGRCREWRGRYSFSLSEEKYKQIERETKA